MKKWMLIGLVLLLVFTTAACSTSSTTQESESKEIESEQETTGLGALGIPDTFGEIKDIVGNEVTLLLIKNAEEDETRVPGSGMGRGNSGADVVREYTGEEVTLLIPVGTTMVKRVPQSGSEEVGSGTGTGPIEEEVTLMELVKGSTLKIYYRDGDLKSIEKVLVQPPRN